LSLKLRIRGEDKHYTQYKDIESKPGKNLRICQRNVLICFKKTRSRILKMSSFR